MYETLATMTSSLAHRLDMLWESVANLEGSIRDLLPHPSIQERHRGAVTPLPIREMLAWEELLVIPPPYPPLQGNGGHD